MKVAVNIAAFCQFPRRVSLEAKSSNMADTMTPQQKIALICENLQEVLKPEIMEDIIVKQNRPFSIYWGVPHIAHLIENTKPKLNRYCYHRTATLRLLRSYG